MAILKFLNKFFAKKVINDTVPKRDYNIVLPYLGPLSNKTHRRIKNVFQRVLRAGKINIIFKTKPRLSNWLKFKDVVSTDLNSHIIYHLRVPTAMRGI